MIEAARKDYYISTIQSKLTPDRFTHSLYVAESAVLLAQRYGADPEKAYIAGVLHDVMKDATDDETLNEIQNGGYTLTDIEQNSRKLWHAIAGAAFIKNHLEIRDEDIISAILCHTTAKKNMSLLDKVLYIADFISEDRTYDGVDEIRTSAYKSLEKTMMICLQFTVHELAEKTLLIHPDSVDAYNQIIIQNTKEVSE